MPYENHATLGIVRGGTACGGVTACRDVFKGIGRGTGKLIDKYLGTIIDQLCHCFKKWRFED